MQQVSFRRINIEAALQFFILLGFALFFYSIIDSGQVGFYVHPRIIPYMKFGIGAMAIIALFLARTIFRPQRRQANLLPYLLFIIPLATAFLLPGKEIGATTLAGGNFMAAQTVKNTGIDIQSSSVGEGGTINNSAVTGGKNSSAVKGGSVTTSFFKGEPLVLEDENFVLGTDELYNNMEKYKGKKIEMLGKVVKDKELEENQFVTARFMMACCAADLQPVGLLCRYDKAGEWKTDTWVKIAGTLVIEDFKGAKTPVIAVEKIEKAEKPANEYVYW